MQGKTVKDTLLFSDVHLKPTLPTDSAFEDFTAFLRQMDPGRVDRLICLGDLFDFWYEYRHVFFSAYFEVLRLLANLREAGVELHLCCGNHDLWAGPQLESLTGMRIYHEPVALPFGEEEALLLHGDGLNPADHGYLLFRRIARNRAAQWLFRRIHPDTAMSLAQGLSRRSRAMAKGADPAEGPEVRVVQEHARRLIAGGNATIVICGHAHLPRIAPVEGGGHSGLYINPGDWPIHRSFVRFSGGEFHLETFRKSSMLSLEGGGTQTG
jgi:UDP-2,3-diacylglucosamine hydrolase